MLPDLPDDNPPPDAATNVVLIIMDSLRKDHVGAYGNDTIRTPNLDALSRESLRFTRAYPESAPTICARRAIHTGLRTWPFDGWKRYKGIDVGLQGWQPIPNDQTTLAETLQEAGYETMFVTDNLQQYDPSMNFQRGFEAYDYIRGQSTDGYRPLWTAPPERIRHALIRPDVLGTGGTQYFQQYFANTSYRRSEEDWFAPQVFTRASEYLETTRPDRPFFLTVDCYDPHAPWDPPEKYADMYGDAYEGPEPYAPVDGSSDYLSEGQAGRMEALYSGEVTMMDRWPEVTDIAFFVRHPEGKGAGETSGYYASTHDVAPTILGFLGVEPKQKLDGQDLNVILEDEAPAARPHFSLGYHDHAWCRDEDYAMFCRHDGTEAELYDLRMDPKMDRDIAGQHQKIVKRMFEEYVIKDAGGPLPSY
jgi:arylsulfatase A-like enzyme